MTQSRSNCLESARKVRIRSVWYAQCGTTDWRLLSGFLVTWGQRDMSWDQWDGRCEVFRQVSGICAEGQSDFMDVPKETTKRWDWRGLQAPISPSAAWTAWLPERADLLLRLQQTPEVAPWPQQSSHQPWSHVTKGSCGSWSAIWEIALQSGASHHQSAASGERGKGINLETEDWCNNSALHPSTPCSDV